MLALQLDNFGPISNLHVRTLPDMHSGPDEVLVEIHAAAVNPSDVKNVQGNMPQTTLPRIPGRDFAGFVREGPDELLGKMVWGTGAEIGYVRDGSHAELLVVPRDAVTVKPASLSTVEAAGSGVAYLTAWLGLVDAVQIAQGETVVIVGGTGAVGLAAAQIASWKGAHVISVVRRERSNDFIKLAQSPTFIDLRSQDLHNAVMDATNGAGADIVFDTVGGVFFEASLKLLKQRGRLVEITAPRERRVSFDIRDFYRRELRLFGVDSLHANARTSAHILAHLEAGFASGILRPLISRTYLLEDAIAAYERVAQGQTDGKIILTTRYAS